jgi:hypothetical protein
MRSFFRRLILGCVLIALILGVGAALTWRSLQVGPDFYLEALKVDDEHLREAGDQLENEIVELQNEVRTDGEWEATITEDQINGWLASDLPEKFSDAVPREISDPRVALTGDQIAVAFRFKHKRLKGVATVQVSLFMTDKPNELGIRIRGVHAGIIPLPIDRFTRQLSERAIKSGIPVRWTQVEGDPTAIVSLNLQLPDQKEKQLQLTELQIERGKAVIRGVSSEERNSSGGPAQSLSEFLFRDHSIRQR